MEDSLLEAHKDISDVKSTNVVLNYCPLWSKSRQEINPTGNRLTKKIIWKNALEEEILDQEYEEVHDEYAEESLAINSAVEIGWFPNTNFDGVDTQLLFDDNFHL